ncbi:MAG: sortase [Candidatus Pacebacteria bacterium]|nr:sortase [Candidatus Paceibacterota bacterium]
MMKKFLTSLKHRPACFWALFFLSFGLITAAFFASPFFYLETRYYLNNLSQSKPEEISGFGRILKKIEEESGFAAIIRKSDLSLLEPIEPDFGLVIPKIQVNARVVANVPEDDKNAYQAALKKGVAHAAGSVLPGEEGTIYLFGHSTDYIFNVSRFNALFYLLNKLEAGDRLSLFYQAKRFEYEVAEKKVLNPNQLDEVNLTFDQNQLILQTCWPPGTTWKRLLVFAKPV